MNDLIETGHTIIVTPGFKFETAVNEAAGNNPDVSFILIDGQTHNGDGNFVKHDNTVCVFFNEHEAGFLAGVAAALSTKTNKLDLLVEWKFLLYKSLAGVIKELLMQIKPMELKLKL